MAVYADSGSCSRAGGSDTMSIVLAFQMCNSLYARVQSITPWVRRPVVESQVGGGSQSSEPRRGRWRDDRRMRVISPVAPLCVADSSTTVLPP